MCWQVEKSSRRIVDTTVQPTRAWTMVTQQRQMSIRHKLGETYAQFARHENCSFDNKIEYPILVVFHAL